MWALPLQWHQLGAMHIHSHMYTHRATHAHMLSNLSTRCSICDCILCCIETSSRWFTDTEAKHRDSQKETEVVLYDSYVCVCVRMCTRTNGSDGQPSRKDPPHHPLTHSHLWPPLTQTPVNGSLMEARFEERVHVCVSLCVSACAPSRLHVSISTRMGATDRETHKG